jgi:hypothetical protein
MVETVSNEPGTETRSDGWMDGLVDDEDVDAELVETDRIHICS